MSPSLDWIAVLQNFLNLEQNFPFQVAFMGQKSPKTSQGLHDKHTTNIHRQSGSPLGKGTCLSYMLI